MWGLYLKFRCCLLLKVARSINLGRERKCIVAMVINGKPERVIGWSSDSFGVLRVNSVWAGASVGEYLY